MNLTVVHCSVKLHGGFPKPEVGRGAGAILSKGSERLRPRPARSRACCREADTDPRVLTPKGGLLCCAPTETRAIPKTITIRCCLNKCYINQSEGNSMWF